MPGSFDISQVWFARMAMAKTSRPGYRLMILLLLIVQAFSRRSEMIWEKKERLKE